VIILDTNVVSELMRPTPDPKVRSWIAERRGGELVTTSITLAEILYGLARLPPGRRKDLLESTATKLFATFGGQVLPFDRAAAGHYADIVSNRDQRGLPIDGFDAQIAAVCRERKAALATRNPTDFEHTGVDLIDPWRGHHNVAPQQT